MKNDNKCYFLIYSLNELPPPFFFVDNTNVLFVHLVWNVFVERKFRHIYINGLICDVHVKNIQERRGGKS